MNELVEDSKIDVVKEVGEFGEVFEVNQVDWLGEVSVVG